MRGVARLAALAAALTVAFATAATGQAGLERHAERAPEISGTTLNGKPLKLSWFRSRTVFLNLWASW